MAIIQIDQSAHFKNWLPAGKSVGVIALSAPTERTRIERGLEALRSRGVTTKVALDPSAAYGTTTHLFSSDSAKARADAFHALACDDQVGAIMAARGGAGAFEVLPLLKWDLLSRHQKPLVGFSDTSLFLTTLTEHAGWPCIHGPAVESTFAKASESEPHRKSADAVVALLRGEGIALNGYKLERLLGAGSTSGSILGGNLSMLCSLAGTPWQPSFDRKILFLEESATKPYLIHRMLLQMEYAGMLKGVRAVLLGNFSECVHPKGLGPDLMQVLTSIFKPLQLPVFGWVPSGHCAENVAVPFGVSVELS